MNVDSRNATVTLEKPFASSAPSSVSESELKHRERLLSLSHGDQINIAHIPPPHPQTHTRTHSHTPFVVCVKVISQTQLRTCYLYSSHVRMSCKTIRAVM